MFTTLRLVNRSFTCCSCYGESMKALLSQQLSSLQWSIVNHAASMHSVKPFPVSPSLCFQVTAIPLTVFNNGSTPGFDFTSDIHILTSSIPVSSSI